MPRPSNDDKMALRIAGSMALLAVNRIGIPVVVALCFWIIHGVAELNTGFAVMTTQMLSHDRRIEKLEAWRDHSFGAGL